jgi:hypothetical protein
MLVDEQESVMLATRKAEVNPSFKDEILKLRRDARFFVSKPLEAQLLGAIGE